MLWYGCAYILLCLSQAAGMSIIVINTQAVDRKLNRRNWYWKYTLQLQIKGNVHDSSLWDYEQILLSTRSFCQYQEAIHSTGAFVLWIIFHVSRDNPRSTPHSHSLLSINNMLTAPDLQQAFLKALYHLAKCRKTGQKLSCTTRSR